MRFLTILLILCVPVLNIGLNTSIKITANHSQTFWGALGSLGFLISFLVGIALMLSLLGLYSSGIGLARAILIMGAISILGGGLFGVFFYHETLSAVEWLLFFVLSVLLLYRLFFAVN